jgi:hypothetical protein
VEDVQEAVDGVPAKEAGPVMRLEDAEGPEVSEGGGMGGKVLTRREGGGEGGRKGGRDCGVRNWAACDVEDRAKPSITGKGG